MTESITIPLIKSSTIEDVQFYSGSINTLDLIENSDIPRFEPGKTIEEGYQRNPKDNIFSIFKNHFPGNKITFASDLNETVAVREIRNISITSNCSIPSGDASFETNALIGSAS